MSPPTQALQQPVPLSSLNLGGSLPAPGGGGAAQHAPMPGSRKMADLREPRGASFLRLAFAAVFLLGFLGIVGFFLKDHLPPGLLGFLHKDDAEESPVVTDADSRSPAVPTLPSPPVLPRPNEDKAEPKATPQLSPFDPAETATPKAVAATPSLPLENMAPAAPESTPPTAPQAPTLGSSQTLAETEKAVGVASNVGTASPSMTAPSMSAPSTTSGDEEGAIPEAAKPAVEALKRFLAAPTVAERLRHTLGADMMQPLMERYYARSPEGPITVDRVQFIRLDPNPELGSGRHCILSLENKSWEFPVPVMLEEQADGFKVDWLAFVEFKDRLLEKFFQNYQEGPTPFHVGIMRHHYFEDGVPNVDRKDAFRIGPAPPNTFQAYAFLDKDSPLAAELKTRLPWEHHVWAIVYLEWKKLGSHQWVELAGIPQMHWYSLPTATKTAADPSRPAKTTQKPSTSSAQEMPPGISKNGVGSAASSNLPPPGISKNGVGSAGTGNPPPPGVRKSTPGLPNTIRRPLPPGR